MDQVISAQAAPINISLEKVIAHALLIGSTGLFREATGPRGVNSRGRGEPSVEAWSRACSTAKTESRNGGKHGEHHD